MGTTRVLVTGLSGLIGQAVSRQLGAKYRLSGLNRSRVEGVPCLRADIADLAAIQPAFEGIDVVVHLAALARSDASWDELLRHNVIGTYNVFEAARLAGVSRLVFASSGATMTGIETQPPYSSLVRADYAQVSTWERLTHESPVRPASLYGVSKLFGEALGRQYADVHRLSVVCLRIGAVNAEDRPLKPRDFSVWCSQRDVVQMIDRAIAAPADLRFDIFFVTSDNVWGYRDLDHARAVLGYAPQDRAEDHR